MATTKTTSAAPAPKELAAPDQVQLRCEDLGETRPFTPKHAAALLKWQAERGLRGDASWQPVAAPAEA